MQAAGWRRRGAALIAIAIWSGGCERPPTLPPELREAEKPAFDARYTVLLSGSEQILVGGVVIEVDGGGSTIVMQSSAGGEAALYLTGGLRTTTTQRAAPQGASSAQSYDVIGPGGKWVEGSAGMRTALWRYQPDSATIQIDAMNGQEARGRIEGVFYRFSRADPLSEPATAETLKGTFVAKVAR